MASKAEILVPGGELESILVKEISPSSMATFLKESHPSLYFDQGPTYPQIFSRLRGLPPDEQEKLLVGFYSQRVKAFPNGAELGRFLARINNISWFQPKSPPDRKSLERLCHQTLSRLNLPNLTLRIIKEEWGTFRDAAWDAVRAAEALGAVMDLVRDVARGTVRDVAQKAARGAAQNAAQNAAWDTTWDTAQNATWDTAQKAARGAEWIVVKDLMPQRGYDKGNPIEPLVEIYELGCWPIGIVPDQKGKKEFVIFIPSVQKTA